MAFTNHVLVRLAGKRNGIDDFSDYMILGDDIVIFNDQVARDYVSIMESIGVETKPEDSMMPVQSHPVEIAKRLFRNGKEVSPLPAYLLREAQGLF
jgi:predicted NAD/FAD-binding protein